MYCRFKKPRSSTRPAHSTLHFLFVWTGSVFFPIRFLLTDPLQCFLFLNWIANQNDGEGQLAVFSSLKGQESVGFVQSWHWPRCFLLFKIRSCNNSSSEEMGPGETKGRLTQLMGLQWLQFSPRVPASCWMGGHKWQACLARGPESGWVGWVTALKGRWAQNWRQTSQKQGSDECPSPQKLRSRACPTLTSSVLALPLTILNLWMSLSPLPWFHLSWPWKGESGYPSRRRETDCMGKMLGTQ